MRQLSLLWYVLLIYFLHARRTVAQCDDSIEVWVKEAVTFKQRAARIDRELNFISGANLPSSGVSYTEEGDGTIARDGLGRWWIPLDPLVNQKLLQLSSQGSISIGPSLSHNPMNVAVDASGNVYVTTRIPLNTPGPIYSFDASGALRWASTSAIALINAGFPTGCIATTTSGKVYIGGSSHGVCACATTHTVIVRLDPSTGAVLATITLPGLGPSSNIQNFVYSLAPAPDDSIWALVQVPTEVRLYHIRGNGVVSGFSANGGWNGTCRTVKVDAVGNVWEVNYNNAPVTNGDTLNKLSPTTGQLLKAIPMGGVIQSFTFGPAGDEIFALVGPAVGVRQLVRVNLATGIRSWVTTDSNAFPAVSLPGGDASGFIYANALDRNADSDGDGIPNGVEILAGANPYDPLSVPQGPKVYLSFTPSQAIQLKFVDPDGVLNPNGGIAYADVIADGYGDILPTLAGFLTSASVTPDGKELTVVFGSLPIPSDLKIKVAAHVKDTTGWTGSDWAVTPPGVK